MTVSTEAPRPASSGFIHDSHLGRDRDETRCSHPNCTNRHRAHCAECIAELCGEHVRTCDGCGEVYCRACLQAHALCMQISRLA